MTVVPKTEHAGTYGLIERFAAVAAVVTLFTGCERSHNGDEMVGTYELVSVNGEPLPARIYERENVAQDILGGTLSLTSEGAARFVTEQQNIILGMTASHVDSVAGTYTYADGVIKLDLPTSPPPSEGPYTTVTLTQNGDELTFHVEQLVFVYRCKPS